MRKNCQTIPKTRYRIRFVENYTNVFSKKAEVHTFYNMVAVVPLLVDVTQNAALLYHHLCTNVVHCQGLTLPGLQSSCLP